MNDVQVSTRTGAFAQRLHGAAHLRINRAQNPLEWDSVQWDSVPFSLARRGATPAATNADANKTPFGLKPALYYCYYYYRRRERAISGRRFQYFRDARFICIHVRVCAIKRSQTYANELPKWSAN